MQRTSIFFTFENSQNSPKVRLYENMVATSHFVIYISFHLFTKYLGQGKKCERERDDTGRNSRNDFAHFSRRVGRLSNYIACLNARTRARAPRKSTGLLSVFCVYHLSRALRVTKLPTYKLEPNKIAPPARVPVLYRGGNSSPHNTSFNHSFSSFESNRVGSLPRCTGKSRAVSLFAVSKQVRVNSKWPTFSRRGAVMF